MADHPFLDHPGPIPFAHRGGASEAPENTLPAFEHAVSLGYRYVETDVHATADDVLVAFHDPDLDRVTGRSGSIRDMTWAEIESIRVEGTAPIPRLDDLLTTWPDLRINIDPKADTAVQPLLEVLRRPGVLDRVCVGSFSDRRLDEIRRTFGRAVCTSYGPVGTVGLTARSFGLPLGRPHAHAAQLPHRIGPLCVVSDRLVAHANERDLHVHVWTIDDPDEMVTLLDRGVHGIMTDRPQVLRDVLVARGEWH